MTRLLSRKRLLVGVLVGTFGLVASLGARPVQAQFPALPDTLTFERATDLLLEHNPQLQAARTRAQATGQSARAQALFPNPTLGLSEEHTPLPTADGADDEWFLSLTQPLNYPGEHRARTQSADAAERAAQATLDETRASLYNELRRRYLAVVVGGIFTLVPSTLLLLPTLYGWFNPEARSERQIVQEVEAGDGAQLEGSVA